MLKRIKESRAAAQAERERAAAAEQVRLAERRLDAGRTALEHSKLTMRPNKPAGLQLKSGETPYMIMEGAGLVEPRREPTKWVGGSQGVSFRVAKGVSYRVGATRGHVVQGEEKPKLIDTGTVVISDQRILFVGGKRTVEWAYPKLLGFSLDDDEMAIFNVANRQKASGIWYGSDHDLVVDAVLEAAIAKFNSADEYQAVLEKWTEVVRILEQRLAEARNGLSPGAPSGNQLPPPQL